MADLLWFIRIQTPFRVLSGWKLCVYACSINSIDKRNEYFIIIIFLLFIYAYIFIIYHKMPCYALLCHTELLLWKLVQHKNYKGIHIFWKKSIEKRFITTHSIFIFCDYISFIKISFFFLNLIIYNLRFIRNLCIKIEFAPVFLEKKWKN